MNIQKYLAFVKTVEYGSFSETAKRLNYSQSGISRMIGDLEKEWQLTLLERNKSGVKLTSDGMKLFPHAKRICMAHEKLQLEIDALNGLGSGLIRIGTFSSVATHWLPLIIKAFQKTYPNVEYELLIGDYGEIETWLLEGRIDCGFLRLPASPDLETLFLSQDRLMAVLPEGHPLASLPKVPLASLCQEPFMLLKKGEQSEILELFERCNLKPKVQVTTWDDYAIMSMVENGLGVSILPELILKRTPYQLIAKELDIPAYRKIGLALKSKKNASPALKRFLAYLDYR